MEEMEMRMSQLDLSLDATIAPDSEETLSSFLKDTRPTPEEQYAREEVLNKFKKLLKEFSNQLSGKDYVVFHERLLAEEPKTLNELSQKLGISKERIRQIEEKLIKKLRKFLQEKLPDAVYLHLALPSKD